MRYIFFSCKISFIPIKMFSIRKDNFFLPSSHFPFLTSFLSLSLFLSFPIFRSPLPFLYPSPFLLFSPLSPSLSSSPFLSSFLLFLLLSSPLSLVLKIKPSASYIPGQCSITKFTPKPLFRPLDQQRKWTLTDMRLSFIH